MIQKRFSSVMFLLLVSCQFSIAADISHPVTAPPTQGDEMYVLKDGKGVYYYTQNNNFTIDDNGDLVGPEGFAVQGFGIDKNFNINECPLTNLHVPIGNLTIAQSTSVAYFVGELNGIGSSAVTPYEITPNLRCIHNSQILNDSYGVNITTNTLLTDVESDFGPLFDVGNYIKLSHALKNGVTLPEARLLVKATSTIDDLMTWMEGVLGINTDPTLSDLDNNGITDPVPQPGIRIAIDPTAAGPQTYIEIASNMGHVNQLDFNGSEAFAIIQGSAAIKYAHFPFTFTQPDGFETADIESTKASFRAYDSLGTPIDIDIAFVMLEKTNYSVIWRFFAEYSDDTDTSRAVGTGIIEFDAFGNLVEAYPNYITIVRNNSGAETLTIELDFSYILGYALYPSEISWIFQDGSQTGTLQDFSIDSNGIINGHFTNGLTRTLGQIVKTDINNFDNLLQYNQNTYIAANDPELPVITGPHNIKIHPDIPEAGMYILKDNHNQFYYTTNDSFTVNFANKLITTNGFMVQGYTVDNDFNIIENTLTDINIPIREITIQKSTDKAYFSGDLGASGISALSRDSGSLEIRANIRNVQNSQILNDSGADITGTTILTDVYDTNGPLFDVGNYIYMPFNSSFVVEASSTVNDLMTWMEYTLAINTSPELADLDGDGVTDTTDYIGNPIKQPGVRIAIDPAAIGAQTYIEIVSNMGTANQLSFDDSETFKIYRGTATNKYANYPFIFAAPDGFLLADIESTQTSFIAYDSLGNPIDIDLTIAMLEKIDNGITWRYFARTCGYTHDNQAVGTGTIKFDPNGNFEKATNNTISINLATGASTPQVIELDFSNIDGYAIHSSNISLLRQNGYYPGTLYNYSIGSNGIITGLFTNGMTHPLGQLILASFMNYDTLEKYNDYIYTQTPATGIPYLHKPLDILPDAFRDKITDLSINGDTMFALKDSNENYYYTRNGNFRCNYDNNLVTDDGLMVQGYAVDENFNIIKTGLSNLNIPLGQMTTAKSTNKAAFSGVLNSSGNPAITPGGITPNLRGIQNSQILHDNTNLNMDISTDTLLIKIWDNNGPLFDTGDIIRMAKTQKGYKTIPEEYFTTNHNSTVNDLLTWMENVLGISSNPVLSDLNGDGITDTIDNEGNPIKQPGVRIAYDTTAPGAQTYIEIVSNMGPANMLDFRGDQAFEIVKNLDSNEAICNPFTFYEPDGFYIADIENVTTSFRTYNAWDEMLGIDRNIDIDLRLVMLEKNNNGITWRYFTNLPADIQYIHIADTGTISFDSHGNYMDATENITLYPESIKLDFSSMHCSTVTYSAISLFSQNGYPTGTLCDYSIDITGMITGTFTSGQTRPLGQIALAAFDDYDKLNNYNDDIYIPTAESGPASFFAINLPAGQFPYQLEICPCTCANLDRTGIVDLNDFKILANDWQNSGPAIAADFNSDGIVNLTDLQTLASCWLNQ